MCEQYTHIRQHHGGEVHACGAVHYTIPLHNTISQHWNSADRVWRGSLISFTAPERTLREDLAGI
jgi:hypothetical protein